VNNFVFQKFLGICPFLGVSNKLESAIGMGWAVIFVMGLTGMITWLINNLLLEPLQLGFLRTIVFILVIAALVQLVELYLKKTIPNLYQALGIYLPLITTNCAVLGVALINVNKDFNFIQSVIFAVGAGAGFTLALIMMASVRERLEYAGIPEFLKGVPIVLITAALMSMAFMGFLALIPN
jgi:electron transport complex protein RnfA